MKHKHISNSFRQDIYNTLSVLKYHTGISIYKLLHKLSITRSTYYRIQHYIFRRVHRNFNANRIRQEEQEAVLDYARQEGNYNHRELTYRLLDKKDRKSVV